MNNQIKIGGLYSYKQPLYVTMYDLDLKRCIKLLNNNSVVMVLSQYNTTTRYYKVIDCFGIVGLIVMWFDYWDKVNECC